MATSGAYKRRATPEEVEAMRQEGYSTDKEGAGRILGIHPDRVTKLARKGEIPGFRVGHQWRFSVERLLALLNGEA